MVPVNEAKELVISHAGLTGIEKRSLDEACGFVLAEQITAPISLPSFRQSSMDGYAIVHSDIVEKNTVLRISGEVRAGQSVMPIVESGEACRIFTGAPVPDGATAVIMQEHTTIESGQVVIGEFPVAEGKNVRRIGQQVQAGHIALEANTLLTPGGIGFLKSLGVREVAVFQKPKVGLLLTGDELVQVGKPLSPGLVYESNSAMILNALAKEGVTDVQVLQTRDEPEATQAALEKLMSENDVILASGGISVGDYDYVGPALKALGVETIFYKVRQKPGKPLLFAKKEEKLFFALPGNPASTLVCFYEYVLPAIRRMTGRPQPFLTSVMMPVQFSYTFDGARDEFLKAAVIEQYVLLLDGQESFALRSFATANALVYLPANQSEIRPGQLVEVHLLPD